MAVKIIGLYFLISGLILIYCILEAPTYGKDGSLIEESKLSKFKKKQMEKNKPNIFNGRTKEWDVEKGKFRQYRSNQGRSPKKTEANYKVIGIAFIGMLVGLLGMIISNWLNG